MPNAKFYVKAYKKCMLQVLMPRWKLLYLCCCYCCWQLSVCDNGKRTQHLPRVHPVQVEVVFALRLHNRLCLCLVLLQVFFFVVVLFVLQIFCFYVHVCTGCGQGLCWCCQSVAIYSKYVGWLFGAPLTSWLWPLGWPDGQLASSCRSWISRLVGGTIHMKVAKTTVKRKSG